MSSPGFADTLELAPRPSVRALALLFAVHAVTLVLLACALGFGRWLALGGVAVALSWLRLRRHPVFGYGPRALTRLTWHAAGGWTLRDGGGREWTAELRGNSLVLPWLLVLNFTLHGAGRRTRTLLGDEIEPDLLRRLRARLALGAPP